jgi:hypothetical protein
MRVLLYDGLDGSAPTSRLMTFTLRAEMSGPRAFSALMVMVLLGSWWLLSAGETWGRLGLVFREPMYMFAFSHVFSSRKYAPL